VSSLNWGGVFTLPSRGEYKYYWSHSTVTYQNNNIETINLKKTYQNKINKKTSLNPNQNNQLDVVVYFS